MPLQTPTAAADAPSHRARVAVVDPASFVLPFDFYLANALDAEGIAVDLYCSRTTANMELVERLRRVKRVTVHEYDVSSTVAGRGRGVMNYVRMCVDILQRSEQYDAVILQYSILPALELALFFATRRKLWIQVHDETGLAGRERSPFLLELLKRMSSRLLFASAAVMCAHARLHPRLRRPVAVTQHGVLPILPEDKGIDVDPHVKPEKVLAFWGLVKPYKGVDLFARLANAGVSREFAFEVHGKWHPIALDAKRTLVDSGVTVNDAFLTPAELRRLLLRPVVFVLPYRSASQSGVLYTLLNYGCVFVSTDVGDNGQFLREHGLTELLFDRDDLQSVRRAVHYAFEHYSDLRQRLLRLRSKFDWTDSARTIARCLKEPLG